MSRLFSFHSVRKNLDDNTYPQLVSVHADGFELELFEANDRDLQRGKCIVLMQKLFNTDLDQINRLRV